MQGINFRFISIIFFLAACTPKSIESTPINAVNPEKSPTISFVPTPMRTASPTLPPLLIATQIASPTLTETPIPVNWDDLPKLKNTILSSEEAKSISIELGTLINIKDTTNELEDSCLWDCVKYRYSFEKGVLTIILIRAGDSLKAERTVQNLHDSFLPLSESLGAEFTQRDDSDLPSGAWLINDSYLSENIRKNIGATSMSYGSIIILIRYDEQKIIPDNIEGGCGGDFGHLIYIPVDTLNIQIQNLKDAGYPE